MNWNPDHERERRDSDEHIRKHIENPPHRSIPDPQPQPQQEPTRERDQD